MDPRTSTLEEEVTVRTGNDQLTGQLTIPPNARGIVLFAHGSGSSRKSPRNRFVASTLNQGELGTLLIDLLTEREEQVDMQTGHLRFDIHFLSRRLIAASEWLAFDRRTRGIPVGYFGSSTGAGAALVAAALHPELVRAVVSRGGRPDLANDALVHVEAPTLLIVGGNDAPVIEMNERAFDELQCEKHLEIVPVATHLFEEAGTLERVAELAQRWFVHHFPAPSRMAGAEVPLNP